MRITRQPDFRSARVTSPSRSAFRASLTAHQAARFAGLVAWRGQPCQKQPSTKTAILAAGKTKSGLPKAGAFRRQPVMPYSRMSAMRRSSVSRFPLERMRDMTSLRFALVKTSAIGARAVLGGDLEAACGFLFCMFVHPVVEARPLGVAGIKFFVGEFDSVHPAPRLGGEAFQHARPTASGDFVALGMQAGEEVGDCAPCAEEVCLR